MEERARLCRQIDSQAKKVKQPKDKLYRKKMTTVEMLRFEPGEATEGQAVQEEDDDC